MRKIAIASAIFALTLVIASCAGPWGSATIPYNLKYAPKSITPAVPSSLVKPSAAASLSVSASKGAGTSGSFQDESLGAFHWIKWSLWEAEKRIARGAVKLVLLDSVISSAGLSPGSASAPTHVGPTVDHVWTDAEVAAVMALLPPRLAGDAGFLAEARLPKAGDHSSLPAFDYFSVDKTGDPADAAYDFQVAFAPWQADDEDSASIQENNDFFWTADKQQFKISRGVSDVSTVPPQVLELNFLAYDASSQTLVAGRSGREGSFTLSLKADSASTTNGVFISFDATVLFGHADDLARDVALASAGASLSLSATGYADDSGGYVDETFVLTAGSVSTTMYIKETFDGAGLLVLVQSSADSTFTTLTDITGVGGEAAGKPGDYDGKESQAKAEAASMASSEPAEAVRLEQARHAGEVSGL
jgi:hypothetical protein